MKKLFKRVLVVVVIVYGILVTVVSVNDCIKYSNGDYVEVDAVVTYAHTYGGVRTTPGSGSGGTNGYLAWEYNGIKHEITELVDLPSDAVEGDLVTIWVDIVTGTRVMWHGIDFVITMYVLQMGICIIIFLCLKDDLRNNIPLQN